MVSLQSYIEIKLIYIRSKMECQTQCRWSLMSEAIRRNVGGRYQRHCI